MGGGEGDRGWRGVRDWGPVADCEHGWGDSFRSSRACFHSHPKPFKRYDPAVAVGIPSSVSDQYVLFAIGSGASLKSGDYS